MHLGDRLKLAGAWAKKRGVEGAVVIETGDCAAVTPVHYDGTASDHDFSENLVVPGGVASVALQENGKIIIGGDFLEVNGVSRKRLARLHPDGTLDRTFLEGLSGVNSTVEALGVQSDGKVIIGGYIDTVNGVRQRGIARLHLDGSFDSQFRATNFPAFPGTITTLLVEPNDSILVGGSFTLLVSNRYAGRMLRLNADGTVDTNFFKGGSGPSDAVRSIVRQNDGRLLVGGRFTNFNGITCSGLVRLHPDGTLDSSFQSGLKTSIDGISAIRLLKGGRILVGGNFTNSAQQFSSHFARLLSDGSVDTNFTVTGAQGVRFMDELGNNRILVGGEFIEMNGMAAAYLTRLWLDPPSYVEKITPLTNGGSTLTLRLAAGTTNRVQYKDSLDAATWTDLPGDISVQTEVSINKLDTGAGTSPQRFYRVKQLP